MTKYRAESFFGMEGMATTLVINLYDNKEMKKVQTKLQQELPVNEYLVKNWHQLNPTLKQQIDGDNVSGIMFLAILYMIVFFGIFGTVLMMVMERRREMAVLIAIGMSRFNLWKVFYSN
jgi:ABC-type lipoprotein release transport system permease subunit